jgi:hypothetical protein
MRTCRGIDPLGLLVVSKNTCSAYNLSTNLPPLSINPAPSVWRHDPIELLNCRPMQVLATVLGNNSRCYKQYGG